jgi:Phage integrase family
VFPGRRGQSLSRDAISKLLTKHTTRAASDCPSLAAKRVTPHVLRHTNAMLLQARRVDIATIALWLGHESIKTTYTYQHADNKLKQEAIDSTAPIGTPPGRYQPPDTLLAFLESLTIMPTTRTRTHSSSSDNDGHQRSSRHNQTVGIIAGLREVGAQLVDDEADAPGGDAGDLLPGLGVGGAVVVGAQQRVDELCEPRSYADAPRRPDHRPASGEEQEGWRSRRESCFHGSASGSAGPSLPR